MNFKNKVKELWEKEGSPLWDYEKTLQVCIDTDEFFKSNGKNPVKRFREEKDLNNKTYMKQWVNGCHFEWLNPRK